MAKSLNGAELADFIKERQAKQVRNLRQSHKIFPKLVIIMSEQAAASSQTYVRMKQRYASDILIDTEVIACAQSEMAERIAVANADDSVHGIIVQLPLDDPTETDKLVSRIAPAKDVDGLGESASYISATAEAIDWLLAGYGIDIKQSTPTVVGQGKLVGAPLVKLWREQGIDVTVMDKPTPNATEIIHASQLIVSATGVPRLITSDMIAPGAVVVDAGTASEDGVLVGDVEESARDRMDITITPIRGGVGPLTIALLFDHVIQAALTRISD